MIPGDAELLMGRKEIFRKRSDWKTLTTDKTSEFKPTFLFISFNISSIG